MIYFYNQPEFTVNWQQAYEQLNQKFQNLTRDYASAIQLRQKIRQKIQTVTKENQSLKLRKQQKEPQSVQKESSSYVPSHLVIDKAITSKNTKRTASKIKIELSESISAKEEVQVYQCTYEGCHKHYSTPVAMNLHIKQKHNGGTKKERQAFARMILQAQQKGEQIPNLNINLPPNFLQEYRTSYEYMKKYCM